MHPLVPLCLDKIPFSYLEIGPHTTFSGIYACLCKVNNKFYLGSSGDFIDRKWHHLNDLKKKNHDNIYFQNAFNKYGIENFEWFKIEDKIAPDKLLTTEDFYLDKYKPYKRENGYNISPSATSGRVLEYSFIKLTGEIISGKNLSEFISKNNYGYNSIMSLLSGERIYYKDLVSLHHKDKIDWVKNDIQERYSKDRYFKLISPQGKIVEGDKRKEFCLENNLDFKHFRGFLNNKKHITYGGWRVFNSEIYPDRDLTIQELDEIDRQRELKRVATKSKKWIFYLNGNPVEIVNLQYYCRENNLCPFKMTALHKGIILSSYKGFTSGIKEIREKQEKYLKCIVIDNQGNQFIYNSTKEFVAEFNLSYSGLAAASYNDRFYKGFFCIMDISRFTEEEIEAKINIAYNLIKTVSNNKI